MKVFITREISEKAIDLLNKEKFKVVAYKKDKPIPQKELIKKVKDADGIISLLTEKFDKELIDQIPDCKIIANVAVGYDNIDTAYAKAKNIIVTIWNIYGFSKEERRAGECLCQKFVSGISS